MAEYVHYTEEQPKVLIIKIGKFSTSSIEIIHLAIALFMIILTLMVLNRALVSQIGLVWFTIIYLLTIGSGFIFHELAHKLVAQHYGYVSEFRGDFLMMIFALGLAFTGVTFLAPGAVLILTNKISVKRNGIISVAGPLTNLILAIIFLGLGIITSSPFLLYLSAIGVSVNSILGIFNMLPFWILDGKKILAWNKPIYFTVLLTLIGVFLLGINYL